MSSTTVVGTNGPVQIEITGVPEVMNKLVELGAKIKNSVTHALIQNTAYAEVQIRESILGMHTEKKSVNTGLFASSITSEVNEDEMMGQAFPKSIAYPGGKTTTDQVALFLEYGTTKLAPRKHFENTLTRIKPKVEENFKQAIQKDATI